jgi:hypothetical protein
MKPRASCANCKAVDEQNIWLDLLYHAAPIPITQPSVHRYQDKPVLGLRVSTGLQRVLEALIAHICQALDFAPLNFARVKMSMYVFM